MQQSILFYSYFYFQTENKVGTSYGLGKEYQIPEERIICCRKTSPCEFTYDFADKVFGHEILYRSSLNGTVSNVLKKHNPDIQPKPALDKEKLMAIQGKKF